MINLVTLAVALFVAFGVSSASYSYKAMAMSLILQVREGARSVAHGHGIVITPWAACDLMGRDLGLLQLLLLPCHV